MSAVFPGARLMQVVEWGYPKGSLRPTPPATRAYSTIHITANLASAENEAAWRIRDAGLQNSATFFVNRDGSVVQLLGDPYRMDPWANGDVKSPDTSNPRIAQMVRDGVNANERTLVAIENVGNEIAWGSVPGGHPITPAQEETDARIIAHYHPKAGVPISRETVIGHYQLNSVSRANCPARDKRLIDRIVARAQAIVNQEDTVADIDTFILETIRIDANANIRSGPDDGASLLFKTASPSSALSVGTKNGFHAYWLMAQKRWAYTSTQHNVLSREPYQTTVEVPTGVPQADYDAARAQVNALTARISTKDAYVAKYPKG